MKEANLIQGDFRTVKRGLRVFEPSGAVIPGEFTNRDRERMNILKAVYGDKLEHVIKISPLLSVCTIEELKRYYKNMIKNESRLKELRQNLTAFIGSVKGSEA